ncbi:YdiU family protein [Chryseomicrobium sp. FSL W7-1435]|uniref:protein adenylyltransferase SelO n=1 Tax=Chryseomicrobium sp. FSL W7-1435 TaxID=2921704 RepID=UPI00315AF3B8
MHFTQSYLTLPATFYKEILPTPVAEPQLIIWNESVAEELGFSDTPTNYTKFLAGNETFESSQPIAQAYAGHQFANFTMLGDGRAILLGELKAKNDSTYDIQLKGSGRTPFSRGGDGRAALGPMLREYIISEAMHHLGIPTTRSLAVIYSGEGIQRETVKPGAVLTRIAKSHIRVGTFQYAAQFGSIEELRALADYTIEHLFIPENEKPYESLLQEVIQRQATLIAQWQLIGFVHGVMNTDNMALSGETIDYGPCAFLDNYDPATVFSSIDQQGRYAYGNQPGIAGWNLARFAESLLPLLSDNQEQAVERAQAILDSYPKLFEQAYNEGLCRKFGLTQTTENTKLASDFLQLMQTHKADYTDTFRALTLQDYSHDFFGHTEVQSWLERFEQSMGTRTSQHQHMMEASNPVIIPRNHLVQQALDEAETGSMEKVITLLEHLEKPYTYSPAQLDFDQRPPETGRDFVTYCGT